MLPLFLLISNLFLTKSESVPFFIYPIKSNEHRISGLNEALDESVDPCSNFYQYACGGWMNTTKIPEHQPLWNNWELLREKIYTKLRFILETKQEGHEYFKKAQLMFNACLHNKHPDLSYIKNLKSIIQMYKEWPLVSEKWNSTDYKWELIVAKIIRTIGAYPLLKMHVFLNLRNTSKYNLYIEKGELNLPELLLTNPRIYTNYLKAYERWIVETARYLYPHSKQLDLKYKAAEIIKFECKLAKLHELKEKSEEITIEELYKVLPIEWNLLFTKLFHSTDVRLNSNDTIILRSREYLKKLKYLISNTKISTIANYIIWSVIKTLSRDLTDNMRHLNFMMDHLILGVKQDIPRTQECLNKITTYMDAALVPNYNHLYLNNNIIKDVTHMVENIKEEFVKVLNINEWLDNKTKHLTIEKIKAVQYIVGYPQVFQNESYIDDMYKNVIIDDNHFVNIIRLRAFKIKQELEKLLSSPRLEVPANIYEINAYYNILQNSIYIPLGLLQPPFYDYTASRTSNYGSLGTLIGHEISHALDNLGRHADINGNIINWWTREDINNYDKATDCFTKLYNKNNVDGFHTLGENIADNVGLQLSYNALKRLNISHFRVSNEKLFSLLLHRYGVKWLLWRTW